MDRVPVLDLTDDPTTIVQQLDDALRRYGFFYVTNHGISEQLIRDQFDVAALLFDLTFDTKQTMPFDPLLDIGYLASGGQAVGLTKMDQQPQEDEDGGENGEDKGTSEGEQRTGTTSQIDTKEQFMMTTNKLITNNRIDTDDDDDQWEVDPDNVFAGSKNYNVDKYVPNHSTVTSAYLSAAYKLNVKLQDYLFDAMYLSASQGDGNDNDETLDEEKHNTRRRLGAHPFLVLKQMKYDAGRDGLPSDPSKGRYGAGPHTDWGSFTILATDQTPGLQIYRPEYGTWLDVPPLPNTLIINAGDQISILTNQVYKSALHRVLIHKETIHKPRFSTAVFAYFGMDATFAPLPHFVSATGDGGGIGDGDGNGNNERDGEDATTMVVVDPSHGRTTREYFHYKLHQSVFGLVGQ